MIVRYPLHEPRAEHWRKRERDHAGNQDRRGHRQGEFTKDAADDAAHEQQRDEYCDKRQTDRKHREGDLARAFDGCLERRHPLFDVAIDVFNDHDRVIDHETDRDGERHQRDIVDAEIERVHGGE